MKRNSIAFLSTNSNTNEDVKSYLKQFTHQIDEYTSEKDLVRASELYYIFLLEEIHPTVRGGELIIQVKKNNPNARFFFISELLVLLKGESPLEWKNKFFSFPQYLLSLDKKKSQDEDLHPVEARLSSQRLTPPKTLSEREKEIVNLLLSGSTISQSAIKLKISFHTVNNYVKRIYKKLGVRSRSELFSKIYINNY